MYLSSLRCWQLASESPRSKLLLTPAALPTAQGSASVAVLHSADYPHGLASFADWRAFSEAAEKKAGAALTLSLCFGLAPVGFIVLLLPPTSVLAAGGHVGALRGTDELETLARSMSSSIVLSRLKNLHSTSLSALRVATSITRDIYPERVARKLEARLGTSLRCPIPVKGDLDELEWTSARLSAVPSAPASAGLSGSSGESADIISDYWPCVTVIFADVTNFTEMTSGQTPVETMELLNNLFHLFDSLSVSHGICAHWPTPRAYGALRFTAQRLDGATRCDIC